MQLTLLPLETVESGFGDLANSPVLAFKPLKLLGSATAGATLGAAIAKELAEIVDAIAENVARGIGCCYRYRYH